VVGTPHRAREYDGFYSPSFQLVSGRCCIRTFLESRGGTVSVSRSPRGNGRAHTPILGGGSGSAERAHLCQRHRESRARNIFWAVGSSAAGFLMQNVAFSAPLVLGGGAKISYDLLLYRAFRNLKPPEEH
jgi:hypothetical protein